MLARSGRPRIRVRWRQIHRPISEPRNIDAGPIQQRDQLLLPGLTSSDHESAILGVTRDEMRKQAREWVK